MKMILKMQAKKIYFFNKSDLIFIKLLVYETNCILARNMVAIEKEKERIKVK